MTHRAALAKRFMLEDERACLFAMTLSTGLVLSRHEQTGRRFKNVHAMRIVALHAVHPAFEHRVMLGQAEFCVGLQMALKAGRRVFSRIDNKFPATTASGNMFAARSMAGFASGITVQLRAIEVHARMRARGKSPGNICMAIVTGVIPNVNSAGHFGQRGNRSLKTRAGEQKKRGANGRDANHHRYDRFSCHRDTCDCETRVNRRPQPEMDTIELKQQ